MGCKLLLTANEKTIKLWKVYGKAIRTVTSMNLEPTPTGGGATPAPPSAFPPLPVPRDPGGRGGGGAASPPGYGDEPCAAARENL